MSVCGDDFLNSAKDYLINNREIDYRNFISRGYYGMFHKISSKLTNKPSFAISHHSALIEYLKNTSQNKKEPFDPIKLKSLGYILEQERLSRNKADYDIQGKDITMIDVELSRKTYDRFNQKINEL